MSLITKYITRATVRFDPFGTSAASARSFLSRVPSSAKVDLRVLNAQSKEEPIIEVTFKDKHVMKADPSTTTYNDLTDLLNSHSRKLLIQDAVNES